MAQTDNTMALAPKVKRALCASPLVAAVSLGKIFEVTAQIKFSFVLFTTCQNVNVTIYIVFRSIIKFPILFQLQKILSTISIKTGGRHSSQHFC